MLVSSRRECSTVPRTHAHTHTRTRTHAHTHTRTHAHAHDRAETLEGRQEEAAAAFRSAFGRGEGLAAQLLFVTKLTGTTRPSHLRSERWPFIVPRRVAATQKENNNLKSSCRGIDAACPGWGVPFFYFCVAATPKNTRDFPGQKKGPIFHGNPPSNSSLANQSNTQKIHPESRGPLGSRKIL